VVRLPPHLRPLFPYLKPAYVRATRTLAPVTQWISRRNKGFLPTGVVHTMEQAAATSGGRCVTARSAETITRPPMQGVPADLPLSDTSDGETFGRVAVVELPDARVAGPHRAVISARGDLVDEISRYFGTTQPYEHPLFLNPRLGRPLEVDGRLGVLAARGDSNYYHFLMDVMPRIGVLEQCPDVEPPDRWYVPVQSRFQRELLDLFGITSAARIDAAAHPHVRADCLVVPGLPARSETNPPWVIAYLRRRLLDNVDVSGPARHVYVTRGRSANNRTVVNDAAVGALLATRGFEAVDPGALSVTEQIRTFAAASVIVAPHGAALANLVFASPGASVVELFPAGSLLPDFWRLASGVPGLRYRYLSSRGGPRRQTRASIIVRDIDVDLAALAVILDELA